LIPFKPSGFSVSTEFKNKITTNSRTETYGKINY